jgi:hypothetical protein
MSVKLPAPPPGYDQKDQRDVRSALMAADEKSMKRDEPITTLLVRNHDTGALQRIRWGNAGWEVVA